ncbi:hypothetical protein SAMN04487950_0255 [Halogranum rubrum]|uniref:Uncharacterized protein n=1 Tax=Halogranum rubrum TaxID=553466 RepID=A0A1I4B3U0_9EURY|nr:hypothetical protein [Halogranum rubrum]SFK62837.1 hypothetical protein SAMN04487950_0255 [Halogranum rubrum]
MQRRTLIASLGTLFVAGCAGAPSNDSTANNSSTGNESAGNESMSGDGPAPEFSFRSTAPGTTRVVHMGGDEVTDDSTSELYVTVNDERAVTWVSDDAEEPAGSYPVSIGNYVEVETANGDEVAVVWVSQDGTENTVATHTVEAETTETPSGNESAGNETAGNETASNETMTGNETTTGNETMAGNETTTGNESA